MDRRSLARVLGNRFAYSEALDRAGFVTEASIVRHQVMAVMATPGFRTAAGMDDNIRYAIRGQLDWEDIARNTAAGAAGGAVAGGVAGLGFGSALTAPVGALAGGIGGLLSQPIGSVWYNTMQGNTSKAQSQAGDLVNSVGQLAGMIAKMGSPQAAQQMQTIAQALQERIQAVRTQKYNDLSKQYGLSGAGDKGMWGHLMENVSNPMGYLGRTWNLIRSEDRRDGMGRYARGIDQSSTGTPLDLIDPSTIGQRLAPKLLPQFAETAGVGGAEAGAAGLGGAAGMAAAAAPAAAFMGTAGLVGWGWNKVSDAIRGQVGVMQGLASDIQKQAAEMTKQTQDPTFMQYGQQIQQIISQVMPQLAQRLQAGQQGRRPGYGQQQMGQQSYGPPQGYPTAAQAPTY